MIRLGQSAIIRGLAGALSSSGNGGSLLILTYHRVLAAPDPMFPDEPDARTFAEQMDLLAEHFRVLPLQHAASLLQDGGLPARAVSITFDDGYANNFEVACPILQRRSLPATVFVSTAFLDGGWMFNDLVVEAIRSAPENFDLDDLGLGRHRLDDHESRRKAIAETLASLKYLPPDKRQQTAQLICERAMDKLPPSPMLTSDQVRGLKRAGIEIGAHTCSHPILTSLTDECARREIETSKCQLGEICGERIDAFAYPNGRPGRDFSAQHVAMVRDAGFKLAVTTAAGAATRVTDCFQLPRITPWESNRLKSVFRIALSYRNTVADVFPSLRPTVR